MEAEESLQSQAAHHSQAWKLANSPVLGSPPQLPTFILLVSIIYLFIYLSLSYYHGASTTGTALCVGDAHSTWRR